MVASTVFRFAGCVAVLARRQARRGTTKITFSPAARGGSLSNMAMLMLLRRMGREDLTAHGFRSTFRDWAAERTNFQTDVAEVALGHVVGDKVEAAYRRGDLFEKRRRLMEAWGEFATKAQDTGVILPLREKIV